MATWVPWTSISGLSGRTINCFAGNPSGGAVIAGTDNGIYYNNTSSPSTWTHDTSSGISSSNIIAVACTSGGEVMFAITSSSALFYSTSGTGNTWTSITIGKTLPASISCVACCIAGGTVTVAFGINGGVTYSATSTSPYTSWTFPFNISTAFALTTPANTALCTGIACNSSGANWVLTVSDGGAGGVNGASSGIYRSTDGLGWGSSIIGTGNQTYTSVTCSSDNSTFIACSQGNGLTNTTQGSILTGDTTGTNWANLSGARQLPYIYVGLNANGTKLYACAGTSGLYYSLNSGTTWTKDTTTPPSPATTVAAVYVNPTVTNTGLPLYIGSSTRGFYAGYNPSTNPICFKEGSKILCFVDSKEVYLPIETLKPGTFVKTYLHGYKAIDMIGHSKLYNPAHTLRGKNRLYVCKKEKYPEITEDLVITGCHSILVDSVTEQQYKDIEEFAGRIYVTDKLCRFPACLDDRAEPYTETGVHTIWHFALAHNDYYMNYGVYANGLLVETTSKRMMKDLSGMELV